MFAQWISAFVLILCIPSIASAVNFQWLTDSAAQEFTEQDWVVFSDALDSALNQAEDGGIQQWSNEQSGNSGSIEVDNTRQTEHGTCRQVITTNRTARQLGTSNLTMCLQPDGSWKIDNRIKAE